MTRNHPSFDATSETVICSIPVQTDFSPAIVVIDRFYIALFSAFEHTHSAHRSFKSTCCWSWWIALDVPKMPLVRPKVTGCESCRKTLSPVWRVGAGAAVSEDRSDQDHWWGWVSVRVFALIYTQWLTGRKTPSYSVRVKAAGLHCVFWHGAYWLKNVGIYSMASLFKVSFVA